MFRLRHFIATCSFIIGFGTAAAAGAGEMRSLPDNPDVVGIMKLEPFTHVATIPASSNVSSIRIEGINLVKVPTVRRSTTSERYCNQPSSEPGGSMFCQRETDESPAEAYRVTFSYRDQPMASDEFGNPYFTFSVYFRPDEMNPRLRAMLSSGKISRAALAEFFEVTTSRGPSEEIIIDQANSALCDGNYVDGNWLHANPKCEDEIVYTKIASPSPYVTVKVGAIATRLETAAASGPWPR